MRQGDVNIGRGFVESDIGKCVSEHNIGRGTSTVYQFQGQTTLDIMRFLFSGGFSDYILATYTRDSEHDLILLRIMVA